MKRLTQRDEYGNADIIGVDSADLQLNLRFDEFNLVTAALNRLAFYEDAHQNGRLIVLPCKVGDRVYQTDGIRIYESTVRQLIFDTENIAFDVYAIGKTVFLTREEAETALKEET